MSGKEPKFGQRMCMKFASDDNPLKYGLFVRTVIRKGRVNSGRHYELTDGHGDFWKCRDIDAVAIGEDQGT